MPWFRTYLGANNSSEAHSELTHTVSSHMEHSQPTTLCSLEQQLADAKQQLADATQQLAELKAHVEQVEADALEIFAEKDAVIADLEALIVGQQRLLKQHVEGRQQPQQN